MVKLSEAPAELGQTLPGSGRVVPQKAGGRVQEPVGVPTVAAIDDRARLEAEGIQPSTRGRPPRLPVHIQVNHQGVRSEDLIGPHGAAVCAWVQAVGQAPTPVAVSEKA